MNKTHHIDNILGYRRDKYRINEIAKGLVAIQKGASFSAKRQQVWRHIQSGTIQAETIFAALADDKCSHYLIPRSELPKIYSGWKVKPTDVIDEWKAA